MTKEEFIKELDAIDMQIKFTHKAKSGSIIKTVMVLFLMMIIKRSMNALSSH